VKAIMLMFDTLNRRFLPPYGCSWVHAPNFQRLAKRTCVFDNAYAGSMPCMPARREIHTGRYNFLHREWGPIEPFDDSMPQILHESGIHSFIVTTHENYWKDGGATYLTRYSGFQAVRGLLGDCCIGHLPDDIPTYPDSPNNQHGPPFKLRQDWINRHYMHAEEDRPLAKCFRQGLEYLQTNHKCDNWFLTIENFDPHEPYWCPDKYRAMYDLPMDSIHDRPRAGEQCNYPPEVARRLNLECAALHTMCDAYLGKVLDFMDEHDMWTDTMLIVNTDHGNCHGEHDGWWGKCAMPYWNEVVHMPLFIWDPRSGIAGERRKSLVQTIDLAPTLLEFFGRPIPPDMEGKPLRQTIVDDTPVREAGLFGQFQGHCNVTDGRYVYMRAAVRKDNQPHFAYTLNMHRLNGFFPPSEGRTATMAPPMRFTKGMPLMRIQHPHVYPDTTLWGNLLYDLQNDPNQMHPISDTQVERRMIELMVDLMKRNDAPPEQYVRLGLTGHL
jgi:arylsulfatase A-like enzyme